MWELFFAIAGLIVLGAAIVTAIWLLASKATAKSAIVLLCIATLTVSTALLVGKLAGGARIADLTEQKLYTLDKGTINILNGLKDPVTLKFYYAKTAADKGPDEIKAWNQYHYYVQDVLEEYVSRSNGKLKLEIIDPRPNTDEEGQAREAGIETFPMGRNTEEFFCFGLAATNQFGKGAVIEFFHPDRQEFVEYDVSKMIVSLTQREKRRVGVLSQLPVMGPEGLSPYMARMLRMQGQNVPDPWFIVRTMGQNYDVVRAVVKDGVVGSETRSETDMGFGPAPGGAFAANLDFLVVVHPKDLDQPTKFAIDQFVMKGGKLIILEDPFCYFDQPERPNPYMDRERSQASDLNELTSGWGLYMRPNTLAVDRTLAWTAPSGESVLFDLTLNAKCMGQENDRVAITGDLHAVRVLANGVLEANGKGGTKVTPLLQTTDKGSTWNPPMPIGEQTIRMGIGPESLLPSAKPLVIGAIIRGRMNSNYPDGITLPPPAEEPKDPSAPKPASVPASQPAKHLPAVKQSPDGAAVVVIADVDFICNQLAFAQVFGVIKPLGDNASVLHNALDFLGGQQDLISLRSRGKYSRPFEKVDEIEREAVADGEEKIRKFKKDREDYEQRLQQLSQSGDGKDEKIIDEQMLAEHDRIQQKLHETIKEDRKIKAKRRQEVEDLKWTLQLLNFGGAPAIILLFAIVLAIVRFAQNQSWTSRSNGQ